MLLDRAFRLTFKHFSTLFLVVATVTVTLQVAYSFVFRDVIAVSDLHPEIEGLQPGVKVRDVSPDDVAASRLGFLVVTGLEIAFVPLLVAAFARVLDVDEEGDLPGVADAFLHRARVRDLLHLRPKEPLLPAIAGALGVALLVGFLAERIGLLVAETLGVDAAFAGVGLARGVARALGAPFFLVTLAVCARENRAAERAHTSSV